MTVPFLEAAAPPPEDETTALDASRGCSLIESLIDALLVKSSEKDAAMTEKNFKSQVLGEDDRR